MAEPTDHKLLIAARLRSDMVVLAQVQLAVRRNGGVATVYTSLTTVPVQASPDCAYVYSCAIPAATYADGDVVQWVWLYSGVPVAAGGTVMASPAGGAGSDPWLADLSSYSGTEAGALLLQALVGAGARRAAGFAFALTIGDDYTGARALAGVLGGVDLTAYSALQLEVGALGTYAATATSTSTFTCAIPATATTAWLQGTYPCTLYGTTGGGRTTLARGTAVVQAG